MASRRSLGGGRVLGNGQSSISSSPAGSSGANGVADRKPRGFLSPQDLSRSDSSTSLASQVSQVSSTPLRARSHDRRSEDTQSEDLAAQVTSREGTPIPQTGPNLVCPICSEEMVTLLQLNRHLDDTHANLEEIEQDEVKNWFEQQVRKAKKFQSQGLKAVLNQKLRGIEGFETNGSPIMQTSNRGSRQSSPAPETRTMDPDELLTRSHWQRPVSGYGYDLCADPACGRRLGGANGSINCRHCGRLFCDEHTMYQMRLTRQAQHDPSRGYWARVCETCYKSRPGYIDHSGTERIITNEYLSARKRVVDKNTLEVSRLEKRLTRLTQLLANPPPRGSEQVSASQLFGIFTGNSQAKALEQTVVAWEDDAAVSQCPFCHQSFTQYTFRRHHCRVCGRVVCADEETACSSKVALQVDKQSHADDTTNYEEKRSVEKVPIDVRMCKDCQHTIFSRSDFARQLADRPPDQKAYEHLAQFETGIRLLLPRFQRLLQTLQNEDTAPSPTQLTEATKIRKRLTESFTKLDTAARRIRDLPTDSPTQQRLNKAVYGQAALFLHLHMLPLKQLPKILKHAPSSPSSSLSGRFASGSRTASPLSAIRDIGLGRRDSSGSTSTTTSIALTALETEEKELRERLIVLEEQRFMVQEMVDEGKRKRRFDEVAALSGNVDDLNREIDSLQAQLQGMDWQSAYSSGHVLED